MIEAFKRKGKLDLVFEFMDRSLLEVFEEKPEGHSREKDKTGCYLFRTELYSILLDGLVVSQNQQNEYV